MSIPPSHILPLLGLVLGGGDLRICAKAYRWLGAQVAALARAHLAFHILSLGTSVKKWRCTAMILQSLSGPQRRLRYETDVQGNAFSPLENESVGTRERPIVCMNEVGHHSHH